MSDSRDPTDCSLPGSSVPGILQARTLEWVAIFFSRGSSQPKNRIWVSCTAGRRFTDQQQGKPCFLGMFHLNGSLSSMNMHVHSLGMWVGPGAVSNVVA